MTIVRDAEADDRQPAQLDPRQLPAVAVLRRQNHGRCGGHARQLDPRVPVLLAGLTLASPAYAGCCTVSLRTGQDPFTRLRGPWVTEDEAASVAKAHAGLRRTPVVPVTVPDDARELVNR